MIEQAPPGFAWASDVEDRLNEILSISLARIDAVADIIPLSSPDSEAMEAWREEAKSSVRAAHERVLDALRVGDMSAIKGKPN